MTEDKFTDQYKIQQRVLNELADEYGLVAVRTNYHAQGSDPNTVLFYTEEDESYNEYLAQNHMSYDSSSQYNYPKFTFQNSDVNGEPTMDFANWGMIDLRNCNEDEIYNRIKSAIENVLVGAMAG